jgi:Icc-related predicted phosphoesterase
MRKILIWSFIAILAAFAGTYIAGCWTTAPPPPPARQASLQDAYLQINPAHEGDLRFAVYGDVRHGRSVMEKIVGEIEKDGNYYFVACTGDMVPETSEGNYESFSKSVLLNWRKTPMIFVPGNHDVHDDNGARATLYRKFLGATHYSFAVGDTLFVTIDNADSDVYDSEYQWLEDTLKAQRAQYAHLMVFMHIPPFDLRTGDEHEHCMEPEKGDKLFALLKQYKTTALFCGHIHAYEEWNKDGMPVYVTGGGGADLSGSGPDAFNHYLEVVIHGGRVSVTVHRIAE